MSCSRKDLLQWFYERGEFPPMRVLAHFLKLVNQYAIDHALFDRSLDDLAALDLPFDFRLLPRTYPQPTEASFDHAITTCPLKPLEPVDRTKNDQILILFPWFVEKLWDVLRQEGKQVSLFFYCADSRTRAVMTAGDFESQVGFRRRKNWLAI